MPALFGIQPVNEPWKYSDLDVLKDFYRDVRDMMREQQPRLTFVFHDAFHFDADTWDDLFDDDDLHNVVMDHHHYFAWNKAHDDINDYCDELESEIQTATDEIKYDIWVGEWSLATENCALWLTGFNNAPSDSARECQFVDCPYSYLDEHAVDFDRTADELGPFGKEGLDKDFATIKKGKCSTDSAWYSDDDVKVLGQCQLKIHNTYTQG